jgi:hypothetical protein
VYYSANSFQQPFRAMFKDSHYTYLSSTVSFGNQGQQARQQINPHFAQSIYVNYKTSVSSVDATQLLTIGTFYFPGLSANHSFVVSGAYQHRGRTGG